MTPPQKKIPAVSSLHQKYGKKYTFQVNVPFFFFFAFYLKKMFFSSFIFKNPKMKKITLSHNRENFPDASCPTKSLTVSGSLASQLVLKGWGLYFRNSGKHALCFFGKNILKFSLLKKRKNWFDIPIVPNDMN